MAKGIGKHFRGNVVAYVALFFALGGSAYAVTKLDRNSVKSKHIVNGQVKSADVKDNGLTGGDVNEASLGQVPSAGDSDALGGTDADSYAQKGSEDWIALPLSTLVTLQGVELCEWVNFGDGNSTAAYFRDPSGVVHLKGLIRLEDRPNQTCSPADAIFIALPIPAGYVPASRSHFLTVANDKPARVFIDPSPNPGAHPHALLLKVLAGTAADVKQFLSLDGITWRCGPSGQNGCP